MSPTYSVCKNHGYLAGEVYICPECGERTEVYSRITGYYRPVQNWNDGKAQEFKDRREYDFATSKLTHEGPKTTIQVVKADELAAAAEKAAAEAEPLQADPAADTEAVEMTRSAAPAATAVAEAKAAVSEVAEAAMVATGAPTMFVKDHCPKCKGAEQRFKLAGIAFNVVNCSQDIEAAKAMGITQTPTIIDPDGTRYTGANAAVEWMKDHA